jgi:hypothetical protein
MEEYRVTIDYHTEGGSPGCASYIIEAENMDKAYDIARERTINDKRRKCVKIDGGYMMLMNVRD